MQTPVPNCIVNINDSYAVVKQYLESNGLIYPNNIQDCEYFIEILNSVTMDHLKEFQKALNIIEVGCINDTLYDDLVSYTNENGFFLKYGLCSMLSLICIYKNLPLKPYNIIKLLSPYFCYWSTSQDYPVISGLYLNVINNPTHLHYVAAQQYSKNSNNMYDLTTEYGNARMNLLYFVLNVVELMISIKAVNQ